MYLKSEDSKRSESVQLKSFMPMFKYSIIVSWVIERVLCSTVGLPYSFDKNKSLRIYISIKILIRS